MTCPILTTGPFRRELANLLVEATGTAADLHRLIVAADPGMAAKLPSTTLSAEDFAFDALDKLLRFDRDELLLRIVHDIPRVSDRMNVLWQVRWFLVALRQVPDVDRLAHAIADHLAQLMPFADKDLRSRLGVDPVGTIVQPLLEHCLRADIDAKETLIRLGTTIFRECERIPQPASTLAAWLYAETGVTAYTAAPTLRVLSIRLVPHADGGWSIVWARGVTPGKTDIECPVAEPRVGDIDELWRILRSAATTLVDERFVEHFRDLVVSIEVSSRDALRRFHSATDTRKAVAWKTFKAVTLWPWFEDPEPVAGFRFDGELHRPTADAPSATIVLHDQPVGLAAVRDSIDRRVLLVCTEPVWRPAVDGLSAGVDSHENRTGSVLLVGQEADAFLNLLFAQDPTRPFHDLFHVAREWLTGGRDLHFLWTNPDYKPDLFALEVLR